MKILRHNGLVQNKMKVLWVVQISSKHQLKKCLFQPCLKREISLQTLICTELIDYSCVPTVSFIFIDISEDLFWQGLFFLALLKMLRTS